MHNSPRHAHQGGTLLGLFVGLAIGLLIALGLAWYLRQAPLPFENKYQPPVKPANGAAPAEPKALPLPGKALDGENKQRFDFYGILEGKQATPNDVKPSTSTSPPMPAAPSASATGSSAAPEAAPPATTDSLFLQVGAFQKQADAEAVRAKLMLLGFEASTSETDVPEKGVMYRVRTGPYSSTNEMNKARTELAGNGIQATLVKSR
jgi:cell division septation protein DedD